jgi:hypothetical protein
VIESVQLGGKLTKGFPAMTATAQVHKRSPRNGPLKWIVKAITVPALSYGMREALNLFKDCTQGLLQRSLAWSRASRSRSRASRSWSRNGGATQDKSMAYNRGDPQTELGQETMRLR